MVRLVNYCVTGGLSGNEQEQERRHGLHEPNFTVINLSLQLQYSYAKGFQVQPRGDLGWLVALPWSALGSRTSRAS